MVEVGLLEHLAQVAGAKLVGQCLLFKVVQVMFFGFSEAMRMAGSVELLFLDGLFLDEAAAGGICRDRGGLGLRLCGFLVRLLLAAQAKEPESGRRQWVDVVRGGCIGGRLRVIGLESSLTCLFKITFLNLIVIEELFLYQEVFLALGARQYQRCGNLRQRSGFGLGDLLY